MSSDSEVPNLLQTVLRGGAKTPIVGVVYRAADYDSPGRERAGAWRRHVLANAALRDAAYMEALFRRHFPDAPLVTLSSAPSRADIGDAQHLVLLFPDSIGLDFTPVERAFDALNVRIAALNGRGRFFPLDATNRRRLARRRRLERLRLPEFAFLMVAAIVTPVLLLVDVARGHR